MATISVKEAMAHRTQANEVRQGARGPSRLFLDALAVLHGASPDEVTRGMKYPATKLAIAQDAKAEIKTETLKISEAFHNSGILKKPLQGGEFVFERGRLLGFGATPPARGVGRPPSPRVRCALPEDGVSVSDQQACSKKPKAFRRAPGAGEDTSRGTRKRALSFQGNLRIG